ncbi:MAG: ATP-binding protein [Ruminococcaceae bacterium]|nr:ATP-binding protein [Oscillospiraceae bacterium]
MENVQITSNGIRKNLKNMKPYDAVCEYIWNGFDAGATEISINTNKNKFDMIDNITIADNGSGINYSEVNTKFKPFNDSDKYKGTRNNSYQTLPHGKNGVGRFTFFSFSTNAKWDTVYEDTDGTNKSYYISMSNESLDTYDLNNGSKPKSVSKEKGTTVSFINVFGIDYKELCQNIIDEFFWFVSLYSHQNLSIIIDGEKLDFSSRIKETFSIPFHNNSKFYFKIEAYLWNIGLGNEYSKFYFVNSAGEEVYKDNTTLNKKSDKFWHSVIVTSNYFDSFDFDDDSDSQFNLFSKKGDSIYKQLINTITDTLIIKRRSYLQDASKEYINNLVDEKIYPEFNQNNSLDVYKKQQLDSIVETLYQAEPQIFSGLNNSQKKVFIRLLDNIMESDDKESLFKIVEEIIDLDEYERKEFAAILEDTTMSNIISTIKLIEDRLSTVQALKEIVFNKDFHAEEVKHVQAIVEKHFWLFGEQYHLLTSTEPDFEEALRRLIFSKSGNNEKVSIDHEDAQKEMDIFMFRQNRSFGYFENIVVELKRPSVPIGEEQLSQLKKYMRVIQSDDRFNSPDSKWTYYLVGNRFNQNKYIEGELNSNSIHGEKGLVFKDGNHKIFVKTWSQIFEDFSTDSNYLLEKLNFSKELWLKKHQSADEAVNEVINNTAHFEESFVPPVK